MLDAAAEWFGVLVETWKQNTFQRMIRPKKALIACVILVAFECLLFLSGCATNPKALRPVDISRRKVPTEIQIVNHGKHTGVIIEAGRLNQRLPELRARFGNPRFYEIGWGDAGFYRANKITAKLALRAVFWPTPTVIHVVSFNEEPRLHFEHSEVVTVEIHEENYEILLDFIKSSFAEDASGEIIAEGKGIYGNSEFYLGTGKYYLFNTCNKWTAKALFSAGLEVDTVTPISANCVMSQIRECPTNTSRKWPQRSHF
ncbi:MAG: TIGR02117 family protein [Opitutales bacterium]